MVILGCQLFHFFDIYRGLRARGQPRHQIFIRSSRSVEGLRLLSGDRHLRLLATLSVFELGLHHLGADCCKLLLGLVDAICGLLALFKPLGEWRYSVIGFLGTECVGLAWLRRLQVSSLLLSKILQVGHFISYQKVHVLLFWDNYQFLIRIWGFPFL